MEPPPWLPAGLALEECEAKALAQSRQHCVAERKRRERINGHMAALRTLLPGAAQSDKASLLSAAVKTLRELEDRAAKLVEQGVLMPSETDELQVEEVFEDERPKEPRRSDERDLGPPEESGETQKRVKKEPEAPKEAHATLDALSPGGEGVETGRGDEAAGNSTDLEDFQSSDDPLSTGDKAGTQSPEPQSTGVSGKQAPARADETREGGAGSEGKRPLIRVRVSAEDRLEILPSFKKTIQLLRLELVKLDTASCWNRVTHEILLARIEQGSGSKGKGSGAADVTDCPANKGGSGSKTKDGCPPLKTAGPQSKGHDSSPSMEVIHAAFKAAIERLKAKAGGGTS